MVENVEKAVEKEKINKPVKRGLTFKRRGGILTKLSDRGGLMLSTGKEILKKDEKSSWQMTENLIE